jgi:hypothetical protein
MVRSLLNASIFVRHDPTPRVDALRGATLDRIQIEWVRTNIQHPYGDG